MSSPVAQVPVLSSAILRPTVVAAGPPAAVDIAIEASHGDTRIEDPLTVLPRDGETIPTDFIPWTPTDPATVSFLTTDFLSPATGKKAKGSQVLLTASTPDRSDFQR